MSKKLFFHIKEVLTLAIFWVGLAWLLIEPIGMFGLAPLLAKFGVKGYIVLIVGGLILGVIHHIVNLNRGKDPYKLIVFETINQKSELRVKPSGLELFLYDFNDNTNQGSKWTIPTNQLQDILDSNTFANYGLAGG